MSIRSNVIVAGILLSATLLLHPTARAVEKPMITLAKKIFPARKAIGAFGRIDEFPAYEGYGVVLHNCLEKPLEFTMNPGLLLIPIVRNQSGEVLTSNKPFAWLSSVEMPVSISVAPGKTYDCGEVGLMDLVPDDKRKPGKYHVRIRFEYQGAAWESNEIEIEHK
ncbi:MAG: hypothetical protein L0211_10630 [Planctomycetaceae bacterium]|nr:hypothetical protein [Planctomycetaceae bacterium]